MTRALPRCKLPRITHTTANQENAMVDWGNRTASVLNPLDTWSTGTFELSAISMVPKGEVTLLAKHDCVVRVISDPQWNQSIFSCMLSALSSSCTLVQETEIYIISDFKLSSGYF